MRSDMLKGSEWRKGKEFLKTCEQWDPCGNICFCAACAKIYNKPFLLILQQVKIYFQGGRPVSQKLCMQRQLLCQGYLKLSNSNSQKGDEITCKDLPKSVMLGGFATYLHVWLNLIQITQGGTLKGSFCLLPVNHSQNNP